jgi:uncharacterized protein YndB with AHSA1/START domain
VTNRIEVSRVVAVAPTVAFEAWTGPAHIRRWWQPHGLRASLVEVDLRAGGTYRIGMDSPDGQTVYVRGVFRAVDPPSRLAYTWKWENGEFASVPESLVTVEFRPIAEGTEVIVRHEALADEAGPAHEKGWADCLDALAGTTPAP